MTMLKNLPSGPPLRPERAEADKAVIGAAVHLTEPTTLSPRSRKPAAYRRLAVVSALSAVSVALVVALIVSAAPGLLRPAGNHRQVASRGHQSTMARTWRLVSEVSPAWHVQPTSLDQPDLARLSCPAASTCYALLPQFGPSATTSQLTVTQDGGSTWQAVSLPTTLSLVGSLSCSAPETCDVFGFTVLGSSTLLVTTNGGRSWSSLPGPAGLALGEAKIFGLTCTASTTCLVYPGTPPGTAATVYLTDDSGATWVVSQFPPGFSPSPDSLRCPSASSCVVGGDGTLALAAYTTDGGSTWTTATVSPELGSSLLNSRSSISCGAPSNCLALSAEGGGFGPASSGLMRVFSSSDGGPTWAQAAASGLPDGYPTGLSCGSSSNCWVSGMTFSGTTLGGFLASTSDGGNTFQVAALPQGVGLVFDVSCPSATTCYAMALNDQSTLGPVFLAWG